MKLYITGGGTGGHVTPGLAIARYFLKHHPNSEVRFAGTEKGIEANLVPRAGFPLDTLEIVGLRRSFKPKDIAYNTRAVSMAAYSMAKAKTLLRKAKPDCVVGCGGYASFPVVAAAQKIGIPTVLLEVNALPGVTTKMLAKKADKVLICFEQSRALIETSGEMVLTGAPVRDEILTADRTAAREKLGLLQDEKLVVSFWGSMGAKYMNQHMMDLLALEAKADIKYRHVHATGSTAWNSMSTSFAGHQQIELTEYIYDMATYLAAADLVLCRAGAATLGELCAMGRPSIVVPSPYVAENHQEKNARALEKAGGCRVILEQDANGQAMFDCIAELLANNNRLKAMGHAALSQAKLDAHRLIDMHIMQAIAKK